MSSTDVSGERDPGVPESAAAPAAASRRRQRTMLLLILAVCVAPVVASYLVYYVFPPGGRTNYGELVTPQRPVPALRLTGPAGDVHPVESLRGQWLLLHADRGGCDTGCLEKLFMIRQLRTMTGKDRGRVVRVWLITDDAPVDPQVGQVYEGTLMLRADREALADWLPVPQGGRIEDQLYVVDPLGNLMMRFPRDADPGRVRKDIGKLLKASRVG